MIKSSCSLGKKIRLESSLIIDTFLNSAEVGRLQEGAHNGDRDTANCSARGSLTLPRDQSSPWTGRLVEGKGMHAKSDI